MSGPDSPLASWLASRQGLDVLHRCAGIVRKRLNQGVDAHSQSPAIGVSLEEWTNDLWIFLKESPKGRQYELQRLIQEQSLTTLVSVITRLYLNHLYERRRRKDHSPWHAYYRHLRSVLADTPSIIYTASSRQAWYAWTSSDPGVTCDFSESDFQNWPRPDLTGAEIRKHHAMRRLAAFFWQEAVKRFDQPCLVSVKSLARFITAMFPQELMPPVIKGEHAYHCEDGEQTGILERAAAHLPPAEQIMTEARLEQLAEQFADGLEAREQTIWTLRHGQNLKLEQIAERLGYQSAAGVVYQYKKTEFKFKEFCTLWPGLSPEDLDERLAEAFFLLVIDFCKKSFDSRKPRESPDT